MRPDDVECGVLRLDILGKRPEPKHHKQVAPTMLWPNRLPGYDSKNVMVATWFASLLDASIGIHDKHVG